MLIIITSISEKHLIVILPQEGKNVNTYPKHIYYSIKSFIQNLKVQFATLEISGRDQQDQKLYLTRNPERLIWELDRTETELWKEPPEPILEAVAKFITADNPDWSGTATELLEKINIDIPVNAITKKLNVNAGRLFNEYGIIYKCSRAHDGRKLELHFQVDSP